MPSWCHFFPLVELWVKEMKSEISYVSEGNKNYNLFIMCKPKVEGKPTMKQNNATGAGLVTWNNYPASIQLKKIYCIILHDRLCNLYNWNVSVYRCDVDLYISLLFPLFYCWMYNCFVVDILLFSMWQLPYKSWCFEFFFLNACLWENVTFTSFWLFRVIVTLTIVCCVLFFQFAFKKVLKKKAQCLQTYTTNICIKY